MKFTDKFLIGIVIGVIVIVIAAFALALAQPQPAYRADDAPENIAHNYLFALQQKEYARAYGYLSPTLKGYPRSLDDFENRVRQNSWNFRADENVTLQVEPARVSGDRADVSVKETRFSSGGWLGASARPSTFAMRLARDKETGAWKLVDGDRYWASCWDEGGCR